MTAGGIRTQNLSRRAAADLRLRPRGQWDQQKLLSFSIFLFLFFLLFILLVNTFNLAYRNSIFCVFCVGLYILCLDPLRISGSVLFRTLTWLTFNP